MRTLTRILKAIAGNRKVQVVVGSLVLLFLLVNYVLMPAYVNHGGTLIVPNVVGRPVDQASRTLDSLGLEPVEADTRPDPKLPPGTVVAQNPRADETVKYGRRVYLSISGGEILVTVPTLRGRSARDAKFTLERFGLKMGKTDYAPSETYPQNTILEQGVQAGKKVPRGTAISVVISRGRIVQEAVVPELVGRTVAEAEKLLAQRGLKMGNITYQLSGNLLPNTIVEQYPRGGESVPNGQAVDLFVVKVGRVEEEITPPRR